MAICWWPWGRDFVQSLFWPSRAQSSSSQYENFTCKMVLKWPFFSDTGLEKTLHTIGQVFQETSLFRSVELYLEDGFEMTIHYGEDCTFIVQVSQVTVLWIYGVLLRRWSWNDCPLVTLGNRLYMVIVQVSWETKLYSADGSWKDRLLGCDTGGEIPDYPCWSLLGHSSLSW